MRLFADSDTFRAVNSFTSFILTQFTGFTVFLCKTDVYGSSARQILSGLLQLEVESFLFCFVTTGFAIIVLPF